MSIDTKGIESGHIKRAGLNAEQRKEYHVWAAEHKYLHFSYVDQKHPREERTDYFCSKCNKWQADGRCIFRPCCSDENGLQCCSGPSLWICPDCRYHDNEDMSPVIVWNSGHSDGYKRHTYKDKNAILICTDSDLQSDTNKRLFRECGLSLRNIKRQLTRQAQKQ